ncbi:MAG: phosphoribosylanthranilate isomerase [Bacteroidota bacterium]
MNTTSKTIKLKVCGMKDPENIRQLAALHPDYMGFIFWPQSPRFFDGKLPVLPDTLKKTGVFVNAVLETIVSLTEKYQLQALQLHGQESPELCRQLKTHPATQHTELIKVFSINETFKAEAIAPYETVCDYFLFDTKGKLPGGNGTAFNWEVLQDYPSKKPFFLSGGIGPEAIVHIKDILKTTLPVYAIDVNSKFEVRPGVKNITQLERFKTALLQ